MDEGGVVIAVTASAKYLQYPAPSSKSGLMREEVSLKSASPKTRLLTGERSRVSESSLGAGIEE